MPFFTATDAGDALVQLLLATEQATAWNAHVVEDHLGGVAGTDAVLLVLLALRQTLGPGWDDERCVPFRSQLRVDDGDDDMNVRDATVGDPRLGAVEHPLVGLLVVLG